MLVEAMPKSEQVQESMDVVLARQTQNAVLAWGNDASNCEVHQGIYLQDLQLKYKLLEPESTWKEYVAGNCNMSYRTARRRIKAAEWHTVLNISLEVLRHIDPARLEAYRELVTDQNVADVVQDLLPPDKGGAGLSDPDMITNWGKEPAEPVEKHPVAKIVRVHCPTCDTDFDARLET
jgi:hypothetical protein